MARDSKPDLPPEFKARCPMCTHTELDWGAVKGGQGIRFISDNERRLIGFKNFRMPAARCTRCNYIMIFSQE